MLSHRGKALRQTREQWKGQRGKTWIKKDRLVTKRERQQKKRKKRKLRKSEKEKQGDKKFKTHCQISRHRLLAKKRKAGGENTPSPHSSQLLGNWGGGQEKKKREKEVDHFTRKKRRGEMATCTPKLYSGSLAEKRVRPMKIEMACLVG